MHRLCNDCVLKYFVDGALWFERRATGQSHGASSRNVLQESSRKTLPGKLQEPTVQWSCQRWIAYDSIKKWRDPNINSISQLQCDKKIPSLWSHPSSAFISSSLQQSAKLKSWVLHARNRHIAPCLSQQLTWQECVAIINSRRSRRVYCLKTFAPNDSEQQRKTDLKRNSGIFVEWYVAAKRHRHGALFCCRMRN